MNFHQKRRVFDSVFLSVLVIFAIAAIHRYSSSNNVFEKSTSEEILCQDDEDKNVTMYAVFGSNTPNGESYRSFDYAYQLPMAALAWERIGFKSVVLIVGTRCEWENEPALRHILTTLHSRESVTVIFLNTTLERRPLLSQTSRIFVANLPEFPGKPNDYLITSDADLWPLHRGHYEHRPGKKIVLVHSYCCGFFDYKGQKYRMYPMGNIGATVGTWRGILNENQKTLTGDPDSMIKYMQEEMGDVVNEPVVVAKETWYIDQKLISVRIAQWMQRHGNESVEIVSDNGWSRVDRAKWDADGLNTTEFEKRYDAHVPVYTFLPGQWARVLPLVRLMYGENSTLTNLCEEYTKQFLAKVKNYFTQG